MQILVDARSVVDASPGGVTRLGRALILHEARHHLTDEYLCVTLGWQQPTLPVELQQQINIRQLHVRTPNKIWNLRSMLGFTSLLKTVERRVGRMDAMLIPNFGYVGRLPNDRPVTLVLHDVSFLLEPRWFGWKRRLWHTLVRARSLIYYATSLLAVSETTKHDVMELLGVTGNKIDVISNKNMQEILYSFSDVYRAVGATRRVAPTPLFVLCLGLGDRRKNVHTAIEAVRRLREQAGWHELRLVLVGDASAFRSKKAWLEVKHRPTDEELAELYAQAVALLYPSWYEGFGLPLHEAAAFGTPSVASTAGALPETAPPGTLFAHPAKPHHWVEALRIILTWHVARHVHRPDR